jgi:hypothetical protein
VHCNICNNSCTARGGYTVLGKYFAEFWQCPQCGYGALKDPSWLGEAYTSAYTAVDIGPLHRSLEGSHIVKWIIDRYHKQHRVSLDYGGGYGLLVRRMRDLGYPFLWYDLFCSNLFAKGFEGGLEGREHYDVITAFEVLEHLVAPMAELDRIISSSDTFVFSTMLLPDPLPAFEQWWYYGPEHGQHVSFYSQQSLEFVARKHGKRFLTNGNGLHVITNKQMSERLLRLFSNTRLATLHSALRPRRSLLLPDFEAGRKRALHGG